MVIKSESEIWDRVMMRIYVHRIHKISFFIEKFTFAIFGNFLSYGIGSDDGENILMTLFLKILLIKKINLINFEEIFYLFLSITVVSFF